MPIASFCPNFTRSPTFIICPRAQEKKKKLSGGSANPFQILNVLFAPGCGIVGSHLAQPAIPAQACGIGGSHLAQDALRRDFTVNALFLDPIAGHILDWVDGIDDLEAGLQASIAEASARSVGQNANVAEAILRSRMTPHVRLLEFSRTPDQFREALEKDPTLAANRGALEAGGFSTALPSGARIYVDPEVFESVRDAVAFERLQPRHVVAAEHFVQAILDAVKEIPGKFKVHEKVEKRRSLDVGDDRSVGFGTVPDLPLTLTVANAKGKDAPASGQPGHADARGGGENLRFSLDVA